MNGLTHLCITILFPPHLQSCALGFLSITMFSIKKEKGNSFFPLAKLINICFMFLFCLFVFGRPCRRFICTNNTGGHHSCADRCPGVTPVLLSLRFYTGAFVVAWTPACFPSLQASDVGKSIEPVVAALAILGLTSLGLTRALIASARALSGLGVAGLRLVQALLAVLLGKAHVPWELGVLPVKKFISLWWGFLMPFLCRFHEVVRAVVLGLGCVYTEARGSRSASGCAFYF